jgi:3-oxoadipate enol-lactonase
MAFFDHIGDRYYYFDAGAGAPVLLLDGLTWIKALRQSDGCLKRFKSSWIDLVGNVFADFPLGMAWYQAWHAQAAMQDSYDVINWCEGMKRYDMGKKLGFITAPMNF